MSNDLSIKPAPIPGLAKPGPLEKVETNRDTPTGLATMVKVDLHPVEKSAVRFDPDEMGERIRDAIRTLNDQMKQQNRHLNFTYDDVVDKPVVVVKSSLTGEVIRQIPNETFLKVAHSIEAMKGLLQDQQI